MASPRNLPCPCGSGKKYKRCCASDADLDSTAPTDEDQRRAFEALLDHLLQPRFDAHRARGKALFWGPWAERFGEKELDELINRPSIRLAFYCYVTIDLDVEGRGRSVIADLLGRRGAKLSPAVRRGLELIAVARMDLYEVLDVQPGGCLTLARVTGGEKFQVTDHAGSHDAKRGELLAARVARRATGEFRLEGEIYNYPASARERVLNLLTQTDTRDSRVFHQIRLDILSTSGGPRLRPATRYPHLTADLRHYLDGDDLSIRVPKEARTIGLYIGRIAAAASVCGVGESTGTGLACRRRPGNRACGAKLIARLDRDESVAWACPRCEDSGTIFGWAGTPFDLRGRATQGEAAQELRTARLRQADLRRLLGLVHLTGPALRFLVSGQLFTDGTLRLVGTPDELIAVARCIAFHFARSNSMSETAGDALHELHRGLALYADGRPDLSSAAQCAEVLLFDRSRRKSPRLASGGPHGTHRLHVRLLDIEPWIWRCLDLPSDSTLEDLYEALILAFGWSDTHLHVFETNGRRFAQPSDEWFEPMADERAIRLAELLPRAGARLVWEYDMGDSWRHEIVVEDIFPEPPERPCLVAGERACPPEDCGGPPGYENLLAILDNPFHEEHQSLREWAVDFESENFDVEKFDERVARMVSGEAQRRDSNAVRSR